jgi:hypothetical protein
VLDGERVPHAFEQLAVRSAFVDETPMQRAVMWNRRAVTAWAINTRSNGSSLWSGSSVNPIAWSCVIRMATMSTEKVPALPVMLHRCQFDVSMRFGFSTSPYAVARSHDQVQNPSRDRRLRSANGRP